MEAVQEEAVQQQSVQDAGHVQGEVQMGRTRGRPARSMSKRAHARLLQHVVPGATAHSAAVLANSSSNAHVLEFRLACGNPLHSKRQQLRSMLRAQHRGKADPLHCRVCDAPRGAGGRGSYHEQRCYRMFSSHFADVRLCVESMLWGSDSHSPVDLYLPALCLAVYVDGEHHLTSQGASGHHKQGSMQQACKDESINAAAWSGHGLARGIKGVVRLHYADSTRTWRNCVAAAMALARNPTVRCFGLFSYSYDRSPVMQFV
mmetsp:Transcript_21218/g.53948  ORF Transcript_21218/g.53948 Transcript_21218/m.53948 type:complete len:260 (-) Transcript_21218:361-1140(-)